MQFNLGIFLIICILLSGCFHTTPTRPNANLVTIPATDNTPPTVGMTINDNSTININISESSQPTTINTKSAVLSVIAGATDSDGGIKNVKLWASFTHYKSGQTSGPGLSGTPIKQDESNAKIGESTLINRFFLYNFDLKKELGSWENLKLDLWTEGENFYNGKVRTPTVSVKYPE